MIIHTLDVFAGGGYGVGKRGVDVTVGEDVGGHCNGGWDKVFVRVDECLRILERGLGLLWVWDGSCGSGRNGIDDGAWK